ncbi:MAG: 3-isopropylmalate dehydratase small subunit [Hyphomicrobiaceae bacterium]
MRTPFRNFTGIAAPMPTPNINTDAIIPAAWLRTATADYGRGLFGAWRYDDGGRERPDFVLNRPPYRQAQILVAGANFGCGSSREAAVWALAGFGFRCVLAPSFADIFYENAFRNGLLAAQITVTTLDELLALIETSEVPRLALDLAAETVTGPDGRGHHFGVPTSRKSGLMRGDDEIEMTLRHDAEIQAFHAGARAAKPWLYPTP